MSNEDLKPAPHDRDRLERLSRRGDDETYNPRHSRRVKRLRVLLPVIAAAAMTVTIVWINYEPEDIMQTQDTKSAPAVGKNELLNPSFESRDEKGQPYKITAAQATQDSQNEKLVRLTKPAADIFLNEGNWLALEADTGEFTQDQRQLLLHGHVKLFHDKGYQLTTEQLAIDMAARTAQADTKVDVKGPAGTIQAAGLRGTAADGRLVFNGPAKLTLTDTEATKGLGGLAAP